MTVLDVFAEPATPRFRRERPAVAAARLAWGAVRRSVEAGRLVGRGLSQAVVRPGDTVAVEIAPGHWWRGELLGFGGEDTGVVLARVRLDPWPPGIVPPAGFAAGLVINRRRERIAPHYGAA
ncbi:MAG: hypothetical protein JSR98_15225 [Proteobacteria bacterium]|nr:hypothetical protein [Pseudomonadota bacterium]